MTPKMPSKEQLIAILKAQEALGSKVKQESLDPRNPGSRPSKAQQAVLNAIGKRRYRIIRSGNQCLAEGTLIRTTTGVKRIEEIVPGDFVYDEHGQPIRVKETFYNGIKEVHQLSRYKKTFIEATKDHVFLTSHREKERAVEKFNSRTKVKRLSLPLPAGGIEVPQAYALGAFLGDGNCNAAGLLICGQDEVIYEHISKLLRCSYKQSSTYEWRFQSPSWNAYEGSLYKRWCNNRRAHEKIAEWDEIKDWSAQSKLNFLAGLIDTDGSLFVGERDQSLNFKLSMQAKSVIDIAHLLILELTQVQTSVIEDNRDKYVNGPVYDLRVQCSPEAHRVMSQIPTLVKSKQSSSYLEHYTDLPDHQGLKVSTETRAVPTYDIHVDSETNLYCLANGFVTHNSGKSTICAREVSWVVTETHPFWKRPKKWGTGPLTILVAGQDRKGMELELWENKLLSYLDREEWREVRSGNALGHVEHKPTGNRIIFLSHSDGSDKARRHMQSYVAHYVWIDEMPLSVPIFEELQKRIVAREGYMMCSFTPKVRNETLRRHIDMLCETSQATLYRLSMLDNPLYADRKKAILEELESLPDSYRNTVLYGDWYTGESAVYEWNETMMVPLPDSYNESWRHVEAVDPALRSKMGYLLWAEDPSTGIWYLIQDAYIESLYSPNQIVDECYQRALGFNITRRVSDVAPWFLATAAERRLTYLQPWNKTQRKDELIKGLQAALSEGRIKITPGCRNFIDEISSCQWSENSDRIINGQSYHCLDAAQYFVDLIPKREITKVGTQVEAQLLAEHRARLQKQSKQRARIKNSTTKGTWANMRIKVR